VEVRGYGEVGRRIYSTPMEDRSSERLLVVEVLIRQGHWSSHIPHKRDTEDQLGEC
jgi:5-deoxy-D-glucuronate isomerase